MTPLPARVVYVLSQCDYDDFSVVGVYDDEQALTDAFHAMRKDRSCEYVVTVHVVNTMTPADYVVTVHVVNTMTPTDTERARWVHNGKAWKNLMAVPHE